MTHLHPARISLDMGLIKATFLTHTGVTRRQAAPNEIFGSTIATLLAFASIIPLFWHKPANPLLLMLAAGCLLLIIWAPGIYTPFNHGWKKLSLGLSYVFIMALWVFYILPFGFLMQIRGKDPLRLRFQPNAKTYWLPPTAPSNMQRLM